MQPDIRPPQPNNSQNNSQNNSPVNPAQPQQVPQYQNVQAPMQQPNPIYPPMQSATPQGIPNSGGGVKKVWLIAGLVALLLIIGAALFFVLGKDKEDDNKSSLTAAEKADDENDETSELSTSELEDAFQVVTKPCYSFEAENDSSNFNVSGGANRCDLRMYATYTSSVSIDGYRIEANDTIDDIFKGDVARIKRINGNVISQNEIKIDGLRAIDVRYKSDLGGFTETRRYVGVAVASKNYKNNKGQTIESLRIEGTYDNNKDDPGAKSRYDRMIDTWQWQ